MTSPRFLTTAALIALLIASTALAHVTKEVGDGAYSVTLGFVAAPLYAGQVEQVEVSVTNHAGEGVDGLAASLRAVILAPGGAELELPLRAVRNQPGQYLVDFIPTVAGVYDVRIYGFVGEYEFDEVFSGVDMVHADPVVNDPASISVP
ncbi:MAG: hypothetical protein KF813_10280 [Trueperaceae bacterium]|nr:hypothetical protein [Trueperaceae bacterium]